MIALPLTADFKINQKEILEQIKDDLMIYDNLLESRIGELSPDSCFETNWLFFNTHFANPDVSFGDSISGNAIFGIADGSELKGVSGFVRLATICVPDQEAGDEERKFLYVYDDQELEFICEFDSSNEKYIKICSKAIAQRVKQILQEMKEGNINE